MQVLRDPFGSFLAGRPRYLSFELTTTKGQTKKETNKGKKDTHSVARPLDTRHPERGVFSRSVRAPTIGKLGPPRRGDCLKVARQ